jgi:hypothetical protein
LPELKPVHFAEVFKSLPDLGEEESVKEQGCCMDGDVFVKR